MARILIIDDDLMLSQMLQEHLTGEGFDVMAASMAEEGLNLAIQMHPDLIMLDVQLPDATGFQTCGRLREDPRTRTIPIIMMTGTARFPNQQEIGKRMGANEYLLKPFDVVDVGDKVHALLGLTPRPRIETISAEEARQSKEEMRARLQEQASKGKPTASSATPSVLHGMKNIPARVEASPIESAATQLSFYKPVASMDLRKPAEEVPPPPTFFAKTISLISAWFKSKPAMPAVEPATLEQATPELETPPAVPEEAAAVTEAPMTPLPSPARVEPAPTPFVGPATLGEFLGGPERTIPLNTPVRIEIQHYGRPPMTEMPAEPAPLSEDPTPLPFEQPPVMPEEESIPAVPLTESPPAQEVVPEEAPPLPLPQEEVAPAPAVPRVERSESFLSATTLACSMMVSHIAITCASGFFFSGKADAIEAFAVVFGGWSLLVGVLLSMAALLNISLEAKNAWKIVGLACTPLVMRSLLSLIGDMFPLTSFLHALTSAHPFFGSSFWTRPWDIFELASLLILGYNLSQRPGSTFIKCVIATVAVGLIGALTGRSYFRPF